MSSYYGSRSSFRSRAPREEVDPMSSLGNIGDIMLVFACGLMVALVVAWNVDLQSVSQVEVGEEVEDVQDFEGGLEGSGATYIEKGTVYQDAETGQYYLMEEGVSADDDQSGDDAQAAADAAGAAGAATEGE